MPVRKPSSAQVVSGGAVLASRAGTEQQRQLMPPGIESSECRARGGAARVGSQRRQTALVRRAVPGSGSAWPAAASLSSHLSTGAHLLRGVAGAELDRRRSSWLVASAAAAGNHAAWPGKYTEGEQLKPSPRISNPDAWGCWSGADLAPGMTAPVWPGSRLRTCQHCRAIQARCNRPCEPPEQWAVKGAGPQRRGRRPRPGRIMRIHRQPDLRSGPHPTTTDQGAMQYSRNMRAAHELQRLT